LSNYQQRSRRLFHFADILVHRYILGPEKHVGMVKILIRSNPHLRMAPKVGNG